MNEPHAETDPSSIREEGDQSLEESIAENGKDSEKQDTQGSQELEFDYVDLMLDGDLKAQVNYSFVKAVAKAFRCSVTYFVGLIACIMDIRRIVGFSQLYKLHQQTQQAGTIPRANRKKTIRATAAQCSSQCARGKGVQDKFSCAVIDAAE